MPTFVALLRAINLGSHKPVSMPALKDFFTSLDLAHPRTVLQTGNVVFECPARTTSALEKLLEREAKTRLGLDTDFFVRTRREFSDLVVANPFPAEARNDPGHLVVMFLRDAPAPASLLALREAIKGRERFAVEKNNAYLVYPDGIGRSRLTNTLLERKLATRSTGRNWNTILKIAALADG